MLALTLPNSHLKTHRPCSSHLAWTRRQRTPRISRLISGILLLILLLQVFWLFQRTNYTTAASVILVATSESLSCLN